MHSSLIGKVQKAHLYAEEPERIEVSEFSATFRGDHDTHSVAYRNGRWSCTCSFFPQWGVCSHVMATQRMLGSISPRDWSATDASAASSVRP